MDNSNRRDLAESAPAADPWGFLRRLAVATLAMLLFVLAIIVLREGKLILQPLFIAVFIGYLILPAHQWLVKYRVPPALTYGVILVLILATLFGLGIMVFRSFDEVVQRLPKYEKKLDAVLQDVMALLPFDIDSEELRLQDLPFFKKGASSEALAALRAAVGTLLDFFTGAAITFLYLIFLIAEKLTFPRRMALAFGAAQGERVLAIVGTINQAISEYLAVKTFISFLAAALSLVVLWSFQVEFFIMWSILIFLFNFIPYLGSWVAVSLPILLSFVQLDPGRAAAIAVLLIAIQVVLGNFLEPRMAGRRLGVSPLLILLSLSFWGLLWGIVGMILAVPLLVIVKIVLENITETKPLATLMSNL